MNLKILTWKELIDLLYDARENQDGRLIKRIQNEINRRHKYDD